ncbi:hypothetical protein HS088_TW18G00135 [Tripterygium wilfordii]|uniref:Uncharacterized protein n=1 Tax=Tripterygium wilfordii TaxID=458696 RepID=A0A7J7CC58_TRIWF|nr:hypothetical protein HS088_TW18G00135 [Tripterygium wilfordii]
MKTQPHYKDGSLGHEHSKRTIREKLKDAYEAAMASNTSIQSGGRKSHREEDPIRIMMFLGSWSHT